MKKTTITVESTIKASIEKVWECWTLPKHIIHWNFASDEWCCPAAVNELRPGGQINWRMEAKDGSMGFDFIGTYQQIVENELITYKIADGRAVEIRFSQHDEGIRVLESFEAEGTHTHDQQRAGWQAILDNFKKHVESQ